MNKVILIGNIATDIDSRTMPSGTSQCTFTLAVNRNYTNQQGVREADFPRIVAWRQRADFASKYFRKGLKISVEGSIQTRTYDAQDGSRRSVTEVVADNFEILTPRSDSNYVPRTDNPPPPTEPPANYGAGAPTGFTEVDDDELPF